MNFDTAKLLRLPPLSALMVIVNDRRNTRLNPNQIRVTGITSKGGRVTEVALETYESLDPNVERLYTGNATFTYNRLELGQIFDVGFPVPLELPTTTYNLLKVLSDNTGIVFDKDDFDNTVVRSTPYTLVASPNSLRWLGAVTVVLDPHAGAPKLGDAISRTVLDDLVYEGPTTRRGLRTVVVGTSLNGLAYAGSGLRQGLDTVVMDTSLSGLIYAPAP